jgi:hypothetical protein
MLRGSRMANQKESAKKMKRSRLPRDNSCSKPGNQPVQTRIDKTARHKSANIPASTFFPLSVRMIFYSFPLPSAVFANGGGVKYWDRNFHVPFSRSGAMDVKSCSLLKIAKVLAPHPNSNQLHCKKGQRKGSSPPYPLSVAKNFRLFQFAKLGINIAQGYIETGGLKILELLSLFA